MISPMMLGKRSARVMASACLLFLTYATLLSFAALRLVVATPPLKAQAIAGYGALLAFAILLSVNQTRRYYRGKMLGLQAHPSQYSREFLTLAESSPDAIFLLEAERTPSGDVSDFVFRFLNTHALQLFGGSDETPLGAKVSTCMPFLASSGFAAQLRSVVQGDKQESGEFAVDDARVNAKWLRLSATKFEDGVLLTATDLTAQKQLEIQLCHKAHRDLLTGLPNRMLLDDRLQQAIERAKRNRNAAAVLMLDVDNLKKINDSHGRAAGDHVLRTVAMRLREAVRATDSVFRLGGDEFVVLFTDVPAHGPVADFARKIVVSLFAPVAWNGRQLDVSASMGVAMYPAAGSTPETLLVQADIEMYRMKRTRVARIAPRLQPHMADLSNFSLSFQA